MESELSGLGCGGGAPIPPLPSFDGNVITPGTSFMARMSAHLRLFLEQKLACDPQWAGLLVSRGGGSAEEHGAWERPGLACQRRGGAACIPPASLRLPLSRPPPPLLLNR